LNFLKIYSIWFFPTIKQATSAILSIVIHQESPEPVFRPDSSYSFKQTPFLHEAEGEEAVTSVNING
jgi:hypothetical protein